MAALNVAAQTASTSDCTQYVTDLSSCQGYLINTATVPGTECCSGIATVEKESLSCLCAIVSQLVTAGSDVNLTRAYAIPKDCNLTFSNSSCSGNTFSVIILLVQPLGENPNPFFLACWDFLPIFFLPRCNVLVLKWKWCRIVVHSWELNRVFCCVCDRDPATGVSPTASTPATTGGMCRRSVLSVILWVLKCEGF